MKFDQVLVHLGEFGRYQKIIFFMVCLSAIPCTFHSMGNTFLSASPAHQCLYYTSQLYTADDDQARCLFPADDSSYWSECEKYANLSIPRPADYGCTDEDVANYSVIGCDKGWIYDTKFYDSTVVTEWDLVCDKNWMKQLSKSIVLAGKLVGSLIFGQLSDISGRRIAFLISIVLSVVGSIATIFSPTFWYYCLMQFIVGMTVSGMFIVALVMGTELVGASWRSFTGIAIQYFNSTGNMLLPVIAYCLRDWRQIEIVFCVTCFVFLSYYWLLPESTRWLLTRGRVEEAKKIIQKAAVVNKVTLPPKLFQKLLEEKDDVTTKEKVVTKYSIIDLVRTPVLRKRSCNILLNWFTNAMLYYGLSFQTESLGSSPYLSFFLAGLVEIPSYILAQLLLDRIGRKPLLCGYMVVGGVVLLATIAIPEEGYETTLLILVLIGKSCASGSYAVVYLYTAELYPTPIRNVAVGACSMISRIGAIITPYVLLIGEDTSTAVPMTFFGILSFIAGLLVLLLPETANTKLPETIKEAEHFTSSRNNICGDLLRKTNTKQNAAYI